MVAGVCWSMSYLVFRLWGSRGGGGGLVVQVIFGVLAVGDFWWSVGVKFSFSWGGKGGDVWAGWQDIF